MNVKSRQRYAHVHRCITRQSRLRLTNTFQSTSQHLFFSQYFLVNRQALSLPRLLHCIISTLHGAADSVWDDINRDTAGLLPSGHRTHLPPVCEGRREPPALCPPLPAATHAEFSRLLPLEEDRRVVQMGDGIVRGHLHSNYHNLPLHSTAGHRWTTIGVVGPSDAMACCCICLPERVPDNHPQDEVLSEVQHLEPCDHSLLCMLWGALYILCRRKWHQCNDPSFKSGHILAVVG